MSIEKFCNDAFVTFGSSYSNQLIKKSLFLATSFDNTLTADQLYTNNTKLRIFYERMAAHHLIVKL